MRHQPHAIRRAVDWRTILLRFGTVLCIGGGIVAVSTPHLGATVFALGLLALVGASAE